VCVLALACQLSQKLHVDRYMVLYMVYTFNELEVPHSLDFRRFCKVSIFIAPAEKERKPNMGVYCRLIRPS